MEHYYLEIRAVHIWAALTGFSLFLIRTLARNLLGARWPLALPLRCLSWSIDTTLLTAALMLVTIVNQAPFADSWLTVKVLLLPPYIFLAYRALRAGTPAGRWLSLAGAAFVFYGIYAVARAHHPLGPFA